MYIGIIVFRLLKHSNKLDNIKPPTLLGAQHFYWGGGARPLCPPLVTALLGSDFSRDFSLMSKMRASVSNSVSIATQTRCVVSKSVSATLMRFYKSGCVGENRDQCMTELKREARLHPVFFLL